MKKYKRAPKAVRAAGLLLIIGIVIVGTVLMSDYTGTAGNSAANQRTVVVAQGASTNDIAQELKNKNIIKFTTFFRMMSKLSGNDGNYKQGTYNIKENAGYNRVFKTLTNAANAHIETIKVTIPEGFELWQIAERLKEKGLIETDAFYREVENGVFSYEFIRKIPKRENRLEGYLFPDTYQFTKDMTEHDIIDVMLKRFDEVIYTQENIAKAKKLGMTMDEVITLSSVIEREAVGDVDRNKVSSVFHNRLKSSEFPYLQSCATVQYILKERKSVLTEADTKIDSPYNTYKYSGLPIGPIASPGADAVVAALEPDNTDYLFFVLGRDGKHYFSKTYAEHLAHAN